MEIRILFDNRKEDIQYLVGWGVSYLIDNHLLFDAGENADMLFHNMRSMGVRPDLISKVIISHEHWDHVGGLWHLITSRPGLPVYVCPGFSQEFKDKVTSFGANMIEVEPYMEIDKNIFTSGEIAGTCRYGKIPEQAIILRSEKGVTIITGCAHNGITDIIKAIRFRMSEPISLVLGGFHTLDSEEIVIRSVVNMFKEMGVARVAPAHCTGDEAILFFKEVYGDDFIEVAVGKTLQV